ncbi:hypothetical protein Ciccas_009866 [Cichlidogyrus casuarinus]|uniref:VASt domain-containing protein n=1 Tax=Cichlidogyrus casuarinus TaxID=1844966 RepID=A0ABD2PVS6_9PLAT
MSDELKALHEGEAEAHSEEWSSWMRNHSIAGEEEVQSLLLLHHRSSRRSKINLAPSYQTKLIQFQRAFKDTAVDTDRLLVDYSCALMNNGLLTQGRMYITEDWICFYSKVIYPTKLMLHVPKIVSITKEKTAKLIPNAIQFVYATDESETRYFFTSFAAREKTFAILEKIWDNGQNHQNMSMDELVRQVRELYGDDSVDALLDATQEVNQGSVKSAPLASSSPTNSQVLNNKSEDAADDAYVPRNSSWLLQDIQEISVIPGGSASPISASAGSRRKRQQDYLGNLSDGLVHAKGANLTATSNELNPASNSSMKHRKPSSVPGKRGKKKDKDKDSITPAEESDTETSLSEEIALLQQFPSFVCEHDHEGKLFLDTEVPLAIDALFKCIFTDCQFSREFLDVRGTTEMTAEPWTCMPWNMKDQGADASRKMRYVVALKQKVGPRSCLTIEMQTVVNALSIARRRYVIDARINNENVPLCTSFHVECRYCLLSLNKHTTRLRIHSNLVYDEKVFFGVKNIIESTARTNAADSFNDLNDLLRQKCFRMSRTDQLSGGTLVKPFSPSGDDLKQSTLRTKLPSLSRTPSARLAGHDTVTTQSKIFQIPRTDRDWLIIIAICVLLCLCLCLSMLYSRFRQLEDMAKQFSEPMSSTCPVLQDVDQQTLQLSMELRKMQQTVTVLSDIVQEISNALASLDSRLGQISETYSLGRNKEAV